MQLFWHFRTCFRVTTADQGSLRINDITRLPSIVSARVTWFFFLAFFFFYSSTRGLRSQNREQYRRDTPAYWRCRYRRLDRFKIRDNYAIFFFFSVRSISLFRLFRDDRSDPVTTRLAKMQISVRALRNRSGAPELFRSRENRLYVCDYKRAYR